MKNEIRQKFLSKRDSIANSDRDIYSELIMRKVMELNEVKEAINLLFYVDYRSEVKTRMYVNDLLENSNYRIFVPLVEGLDIEFCLINSIEELSPGYQGILEPQKSESLYRFDEKDALYPTVIIVPGSVYDRSGSRMGYGKGFYDRFLDRYPLLTKVGLAYSCQISKVPIPVSDNDIKMDCIVTEKEIIRI